MHAGIQQCLVVAQQEVVPSYVQQGIQLELEVDSHRYITPALPATHPTNETLCLPPLPSDLFLTSLLVHVVLCCWNVLCLSLLLCPSGFCPLIAFLLCSKC